ncbi:MAG: 50S ribosome-binding GTPase [Calothrix sp. FI2-JRJ7]|jgi:GTP-binding protein EngB required for normal cell division|nr:50S ribosome-binding GTPase [Calothrix sp. FI2-JRJ7]
MIGKGGLWDDSEYQNAIRKCTKIAYEDYQFTDLALQETEAILNNLRIGIQKILEYIWNKTSDNSTAETAKEVAKQLEAIKQSLEEEIVKKIESVRESLNAKQRALNYFSIAFMGKTKAGKSTLHAIMTGEGWDAIGVGKQRTTRSNRVYEWNNLRIIDTPGIGAPDGKTDEEIAQSVISESDVICYVVTNDSIQESEFKFLRLLKENAKPLIILLNVHKNFRDSRRGPYELEKFINNPDKLFAYDGSSGLGGHIERIRRYARQHYGNDYFEIIPVMLLAAQLSCEPQHQHHKDELFNASRMQNFYEGIRLSLIEYGAISRSQTLLGSTVIDIEAPCQLVKKHSENCKTLTNTLKNKREAIRNNIQKSANDACESLKYQIESVFQDALNAIPSFAEDYWNHSESSLQHGWEQKLKNIRFKERLGTAYQEVITTFGKQVEEYLKEVGNELQIIAQLGGMTFSFKKQDSDDERNFFRIGGGILAVAGAVMAFIPPVAGAALIIGLVGGVISFIGGFFKSKDQKRREAVANISSSLDNQLNNQKQITLSKAVEQLYKNCDDVGKNIDKYFNDLIEGLEAIAQQLNSAQSQLQNQVNNLNNAYAKRIIDWSFKCYESLTSESIDSTIARVNRNFGRNINIEVKVFLQLQRTQDEINRVIQEDICIQIPQSPILADTSKSNIPTPTLLEPEAATKPKEKFQGVVGIDLGTTNSQDLRNWHKVLAGAKPPPRDNLNQTKHI